MKNCSKDECNALGECLVGHNDRKDCEFYQQIEVIDLEVKNKNNQSLPWTGNGLGLTDLELIRIKNRSIIIGIIGAHDTGKTTFLMMLYLQLMKGSNLGKFSFSNSRTLNSWEVLASWGREHNSSYTTFPPHTSRNSVGKPGLLHLGMRDNSEKYIDILLTDAPGEWFSTWAINEESPNAEGSKWIIENADTYILIADCEKLSSRERGIARKELLTLISRLTVYTTNKPFLLLWTKTDIANKSQLPTEILSSIQNRLYSCMPHAIEYEISKANQESAIEALNALLEKFEKLKYLDTISENSLRDNHPFYSYKKRFHN